MGFNREDVDRLKADGDVYRLLELALGDYGEEYWELPIEYAITALKELDNAFVTETMLGELESVSTGDRRKAAYALSFLEGYRCEDALLAHLGGEGEETRKEIIRTLGWIKSTNAVKPLIQLLDCEDRQTSWGAIEALGRIGDPRGLDALILIWERSSKTTKRLIIDSIARTSGSDTIMALKQLLEVAGCVKYEIERLMRRLEREIERVEGVRENG